MLGDALKFIGNEGLQARKEAYAGHPIAQFIRESAVEELITALGEYSENMICKGSPGAGRWADVPWIVAMDPVVTTTATKGYYVVYLFHHQKPEVHLSLNQGATAVRKEFGKSAPEVLKNRASLMQSRLPEYLVKFDIYPLKLGSTVRLPKDYEAGHALGRKYDLRKLPSEETIRNDLSEIIKAYFTLTHRGGLDPSPEIDGDDADDEESIALTEIRRYRLHRKIERNQKASKEAKQIHGTICQVCGFDFTEKYGDLGQGYIEAHHLKPLSTYEEGVPIQLNPKSDFAVLCSNCHRMIHRTEDPSDVEKFKQKINHLN